VAKLTRFINSNSVKKIKQSVNTTTTDTRSPASSSSTIVEEEDQTEEEKEMWEQIHVQTRFFV